MPVALESLPPLPRVPRMPAGVVTQTASQGCPPQPREKGKEEQEGGSDALPDLPVRPTAPGLLPRPWTGSRSLSLASGFACESWGWGMRERKKNAFKDGENERAGKLFNIFKYSYAFAHQHG